MASKKLRITLPDGADFVVSVEEVFEDITSHIIGLERSTYEFTGSQIQPTVLTDGTVVLNKDYAISYGPNIEEGQGTVMVSGINSFSGSKTMTFNIVDSRPNIAPHITGLSETSYEYTGEQIRPEVNTDGTVTENVDYILSYGQNVEVGLGTVTITAVGAYKGKMTLSFNIVEHGKEDISSHIVGLEHESYEYTGEQITPVVIDDGIVTKDVDYIVAYGNNITDTGIVYITGIGDYTGTLNLTFDITESPAPAKKDITPHIIGLEQTSYEYTGEQIKPLVVVDDEVVIENDYTVTYGENISTSGTVIVTGVNDYEGTVNLEFTIDNTPDLSDNPEEDESNNDVEPINDEPSEGNTEEPSEDSPEELESPTDTNSDAPTEDEAEELEEVPESDENSEQSEEPVEDEEETEPEEEVLSDDEPVENETVEE